MIRILWAWTIMACMVLLALAVLCGTIDQAHHPPGEDVITSMDGDSLLVGLHGRYTTDAPDFIGQDDRTAMVLICFYVEPCEQTTVSKNFADENRYDENTNNERSGRLLWYYFASRNGAPLHRWIQA